MTLPEDYLTRTGYRLPTEAEWEHACRAGASTATPLGEGLDLLDRQAWHRDNAREKLQRVGLLWPNAFGLFDMLGNAYEWTDELIGRWEATASEGLRYVRAESPRVIRDSDLLAWRGGSVWYEPGQVRSASTSLGAPWTPRWDLGFRVVRTIRVNR